MIKKYQEPDGPIDNIAPATVVAPSNRTLNFFKDFINRYEKLNGKAVPEDVYNRIVNNTAPQSELFFEDQNNWSGKYNIHKNRVYLNNTGHGKSPSIYTHELAHSINDHRSNKLRRTRQEKKMLKDAYSLSGAPNLSSKRIERFTTNSELRRRIADRNNSAFEDELDKIITNMDTTALADIVSHTNGYVRPIDYKKYKPDITSGKTLYEWLRNKMVNGGESTPHFKDLSWKEKRDWRKKYRQGYEPAMTIDEDKINAVRDALIKVAKMGGKIR